MPKASAKAWEEAFGRAVYDLTCAAEIEGLWNGFAVLSHDLRIIGFDHDLYGAEEAARRSGYVVRIPDGELDRRVRVKGELIAGLARELATRPGRGEEDREHRADRLEYAVLQMLKVVDGD